MVDTKNNWQGDGQDSGEQFAVGYDVQMLQLRASDIDIDIADGNKILSRGKADTVMDAGGWIDARHFPHFELLIKTLHATAVFTLHTFVSADKTDEIEVGAGDALTANVMNRVTKDLLARFVRFKISTNTDNSTAKAWLTARNRTL